MPSGGAVERRIVTVLFADLVGFTPLSERLDPEDVATVQDAYFGVVRETVARYGGELEKFIGDAVVAVFGIPRARDDDAERAVRAALALSSAVEQLGARIGLEAGDLRLRIGVNTGEVAYVGSGPDRDRIIGDAVNTAARFQTAARPGTVLVGETTFLAVVEAIELEPAGALELKGKGEPVPAWTAVRVRPARSRDHAMGTLRAPMIGRDRELAMLAGELGEVAGAARRRWLVVAPPGVGKTRLVDELAGEARRRGTAFLRARCRPDVLGPYEPVAQLLAAGLAGAGFDRSGWTDDVVRRRGRAAAFVSERLIAAGATPARADVVARETHAVLWPEPSEAPPSGGTADREARFAAWLSALDALVTPSPLLLLCEDVHWAGGDFLAFLEFAVDAEGDRGRLIVATCRPSLLDAAPAWAAGRPEQDRHVLDLSPLSQATAIELVHALVGDAVPPELVERIGERSDGNPLFIEELLRAWASAGLLTVRDGRWVLAEGAGVHLPATVQAIYAAQIDDLPAHAREVVRRASVAGRRFPLAALEPLEVVGGSEGVEVLARRGLVSGPEADTFAGTTNAFRHALLRDAGYGSLARAQRAQLHVRLARWVETVAGDRTAPVAEVVAGHYASALESMPALARQVEGLGRAELEGLAATWFERAGDTALALSAQDAARSLFRRALDLTPAEAILDRARRWERLGDATDYAGDMDEGGRALREAVELYRRAMGEQGGSPDEAEEARAGYARALAALGMVWGQQLRFEEAARLADEGLRVMGRGDDVAVARLLHLRAWSRMLFAVQPGIRQDFERALALARASGDAALELEVAQSLAQLAVEEGEVALDEVLEGNRRIWELALGLGAWQRAVRTMRLNAGMLIEDRTAEAWPLLEEAADLAEAHGLREDVAWIDYGRAEAGFVTGEWDRAWDAAIRALELAERNAYHRAAARTWSVLAPMALARGRRDVLERAAAWFDRYRGIFPPSPYAKLMVGAMDLRFAAAGVRPPDESAGAGAAAAWDEWQGGGSVWDAAETLAEGWIARGELDDVRALLAAMARWHDHPLTGDLGRGTHALIEALLHLAEWRVEPAASTARRAAEAFRRCSAPWWLAKAIRVLEATGAATPELAAEAAEIERSLAIANA